jgi:hypothetical protein
MLCTVASDTKESKKNYAKKLRFGFFWRESNDRFAEMEDLLPRMQRENPSFYL